MGIKKATKLAGVKTLTEKDGLKLLAKAITAGKLAAQKAIKERRVEQKKARFSKLYIGPEQSNPNLPKTVASPFIDKKPVTK